MTSLRPILTPYSETAASASLLGPAAEDCLRADYVGTVMLKYSNASADGLDNEY